MNITLYEAPMSSAMPVAHALLELDLPHERITFTLADQDQRKPEFLKLNPNGKVPTVVIDDTPIFESLAIMTYLGERFGVERNLWPAAESPLRMEAMAWSTWAYVTYNAAISRLNHAESDQVPAAFHNAAQAKQVREQLGQLLTILNAQLEGRTYLLGQDFSLADVMVASSVIWGTYCNIPVGDYPNVQAWIARFQKRPMFTRVWGGSAAA